MPHQQHPSPEWNDTAWAEWGVGLVDPIIDPRDRILTLEDMHAQAATHPRRAAVLLAGVTCDLIDSLPAADPWRHPDPDAFGTWHDGTDLMPPQVVNVREDIGLVALARPLSPEAVQVITRASAGWSDLADHLETLDDLVAPATRAISRLAWRRNAYLGPGDFFPALSVFTWINIARDVIAGVPPADELTRARNVHTARIPDLDYAPL